MKLDPLNKLFLTLIKLKLNLHVPHRDVCIDLELQFQLYQRYAFYIAIFVR